jgi:hypothetical protein
MRALQLRALREAGIAIEDDPVAGEELVYPGGDVRLSINPKSWRPRLDPSESPFDAAARHIARLSPRHAHAYEYLASQMSPMDPRCELTICIPVASEEKIETLAKTLANLSHQTCAKDRFEVLLLINDPYEDGPPSEDIDQAFLRRCEPFFDVIDAAREQGLSVEVCAAAAPADLLTIGHIRAALHSVAIERYRQRGPHFPDHLLMRADADMDYVEPAFVESLLEYGRENPTTLNFFGRLRATPDALIEDPLLLFGYHLYHELIDIRTNSGRTPCGGPHATTWLTSYVQSGGFESWRTCGEDVVMDEALGSLANDHAKYTPFVYLGRETTIYTNTRRAEIAGLVGLPPAQQWRSEVARFSASNPEVRSSDPQNHGAFEEAVSDPLLRIQIEDALNLTIQVMFDRKVYRDHAAMQGLIDTLSPLYGFELSIIPCTQPNKEGAIEYRFVIESLGAMVEWLRGEREALMAEQVRMQQVNPAYAPITRTRARGLKYDQQRCEAPKS